jgi:hypothetical protein
MPVIFPKLWNLGNLSYSLCPLMNLFGRLAKIPGIDLGEFFYFKLLKIDSYIFLVDSMCNLVFKKVCNLSLKVTIRIFLPTPPKRYIRASEK